MLLDDIVVLCGFHVQKCFLNCKFWYHNYADHFCPLCFVNSDGFFSRQLGLVIVPVSQLTHQSHNKLLITHECTFLGLCIRMCRFGMACVVLLLVI